MNKKAIITFLVTAMFAAAAWAQGRMDLRISEVMVNNTANYVDECGKHSAWIEIFNASHGTNAIEKMFITTKNFKAAKVDPEELKKDPAVYEIPRGDYATKVKPRTQVVFFADGNSAAGTFHLPFKLQTGVENYIALYDVNGDLVDEVNVPSSLGVDHSWARHSEDAIDLHKKSRNYDAKEWSERDGTAETTAITPGKFNSRPVNENIEKFAKNDPHGFFITGMAMAIVFSALFMLFVCFLLFGKAFKAGEKKAAADEGETTAPAAAARTEGDEAAIAAIAMALYQHLNAHDEESGVITFDHSHEEHSAWGSKGNLLLKQPEHHEHHEHV